MISLLSGVCLHALVCTLAGFPIHTEVLLRLQNPCWYHQDESPVLVCTSPVGESILWKRDGANIALDSEVIKKLKSTYRITNYANQTTIQDSLHIAKRPAFLFARDRSKFRCEIGNNNSSLDVYLQLPDITECQDSDVTVVIRVLDTCWFYNNKSLVLVCTAPSTNGPITWREDNEIVAIGGETVSGVKSLYSITSYTKDSTLEEHLLVSKDTELSLVQEQSEFVCEHEGFSSAEVKVPISDAATCRVSESRVQLGIEDPCWFYRKEDPVLICTVQNLVGSIEWRRDSLLFGFNGRPVGRNKHHFTISRRTKANETRRQQSMRISQTFALRSIQQQAMHSCESMGYSSYNLKLSIPDFQTCHRLPVKIHLKIKDQCWFYKSEDPVLVCTVDNKKGPIRWWRDGTFIASAGTPVSDEKSSYEISRTHNRTAGQEMLRVVNDASASIGNHLKHSHKYRCMNQDLTSNDVIIYIPECYACQSCLNTPGSMSSEDDETAKTTNRAGFSIVLAVVGSLAVLIVGLFIGAYLYHRRSRIPPKSEQSSGKSKVKVETESNDPLLPENDDRNALSTENSDKDKPKARRRSLDNRVAPHDIHSASVNDGPNASKQSIEDKPEPKVRRRSIEHQNAPNDMDSPTVKIPMNNSHGSKQSIGETDTNKSQLKVRRRSIDNRVGTRHPAAFLESLKEQ